MVEVWITLAAGGALVLVGFAAAQVFDRFRIPDYFLLMGVGLLLGSGWVPTGGVDIRTALAGVAPLLTNTALAFILFEGGLVLHVRGISRMWSVATAHTALAIALSVLGVWFVGMQVLGLASTTALIIALAFCGPSATIVLSFLPRSLATDRTRFALTAEGVIGNIVAAAFVLLLVRIPGTSADASTLVPFLANVGGAALVAAVVGLAWAKAMAGAQQRTFSFMTSVALALLLYAIGEGPLRGNGGLAAFVFGFVLGLRRVLVAPHPGTPGSRGLQEFHRELVFLLRTFFFVYLGLRVRLWDVGGTAVFGAALFILVFLLSRLPSTAIVRRMWRLPKLDARILRATVGRGMTDTVLILFAIEVGVIPATEAALVTELLFLVILFAATASAVLVALAELAARGVPRPAPEVDEWELAAKQGPEPQEFEQALAEFLDDPIVRRGEVD
jgi:potassium/hydrogen antiporter